MTNEGCSALDSVRDEKRRKWQVWGGEEKRIESKNISELNRNLLRTGGGKGEEVG